MGQHIVLFHSALGRRPAVLEWADRLRAAGHVVETPDLFAGAVFDDLAEGVRLREEIGLPALIGRSQAAVADLPNELVFAGFSMGAAAAEFLAATRPGARAALLMHGAFAPGDYGIDGWPGIPVEVHHAADDPLVEHAQVAGLEAAVRASGGQIATYLYQGDRHLFADAGSPDYDAAAAELMLRRALDFLAVLPPA